MTYTPIIGLEVHVELATASKMFCPCSAEHFGVEPNTHTCPVCLGLPGALPVPNKKAIEWTVLLGLALNCKINSTSKFDRKNYFYPDLPKGYQISQYDEPLCVNGWLEVTIGSEVKKIRIRRIHQEEDTGKLQHTELDGEKVVLVDFNRSGVPLTEIVTEPDFRSLEEVDIFLKKLQRLIRYLGISNADMEKGSMRLEPSISIKPITNANVQRPAGATEDRKVPERSEGFLFPLPNDQLPKYRVELKNINSFRFGRKALEYEIKRQTELLERGETPAQQTRGWSEEKNATVPQREKEEANDYRYFPEPDIPPIEISAKTLARIRQQLPELPDIKLNRFCADYGISEYNANLLVEDRVVADYFETAVKDGQDLPPAEIANWMVNKKDNLPPVPAELVKLIRQTKTVVSITEVELDKVLDRVLLKFPTVVADYKKGKQQAIGVLIGVVLKETNLDKQLVINRLQKRLAS